MKERLLLKGTWWDPINPTILVQGILNFDHDSGGLLELDGTFKNITDADINLKFSPPILTDDKIKEKRQLSKIYGITYNGEEVTLKECHEVEFTRTLEKKVVVYKTSFSISSVIVGMHFKESKITSMVVIFSLLDRWISDIIIGGKFGKNFAYFGADETKDTKYTINQDLHICMKKSPKIDVSQNEGIIKKVVMESEISVEIIQSISNKLDDYLKTVSTLNDFFGLFTDKSIRTVAINFTTIDSKIIQSDNNNFISPEIQLYLSGNQKFKVDYSLKSMPLFHHKELKNIFGILLQKYYTIYKNYEICYNLFFTNFYDEQLNIHNSFLNFIQALESFHSIHFPDKTEMKKNEFEKFLEKINSVNFSEMEIRLLDLDHINDISLIKRLLQLITTHKELRKIFKNRGEIDSFTYKVVKTRNYYTHHDESVKQYVLEGDDLYIATKKLQIILHFYLLLILGISPTQLETVFKRNKDYSNFFESDQDPF